VLIIVEGTDGAGKSTLVSKIAADLICDPGPDVEILHRGPPKNHPLIEYETPLFDYRPGSGRHIICDRWHVGEWVYPKVMGRSTQADEPTWVHIELFLRSRGALTIYLPTSLGEMERRIRDRGDDYVDVSQLAAINYGFMNRFTKLLSARTTGETPSKIIKLARIIELQAHIRHNGSYVGSSNPKALLVGERREFNEPYPPAFGPFPATSGHYLLSSLIPTDLMRRVGLANAYEEDLYDLWSQLEKPIVVALGRRAHRELDAAGVPHGSVPHPQYVRRFHHKHSRWYAGLIEKAMFSQEDLHSCRP
jgi:hypothetical protein